MEQGPYYREGAPWTKALCAPSEPGTPLLVAGSILGADTCEPLPGAVIDVWQADAEGHYDFQDTPPPASPSVFRMRGRLLSDSAGRYAFSSVVPGNYQAGEGHMRAKHVHYLVGCRGYESLITQLYFQGDPWNERDPLVRASLTRALRPAGPGLKGLDFDLVLRKERPVEGASLRSFHDFLGDYEGQGKLLEVAWTAGQLTVVMEGDRAELRFQAPNRFFAPQWAAWITFVRDEEGRVVEVLGELPDGRRGRLKKVR